MGTKVEEEDPIDLLPKFGAEKSTRRLLSSVRGRSKSVGRGRFLTTDRPVDFGSTDRKNDRSSIFAVFSVKSNHKRISAIFLKLAIGRYLINYLVELLFAIIR